MKQLKPNWKKKFEETAGLLKLCREGSQALRVESEGWEKKYLDMLTQRNHAQVYVENSKKELATRPTFEKIVEKEVLPLAFTVIYFVQCLVFAILFSICWVKLGQLEQPILSPYPVPTYMTITKYIYDDKDLQICKDAWREDHAELKVLRRKLRDRNEGTTYVP